MEKRLLALLMTILTVVSVMSACNKAAPDSSGTDSDNVLPSDSVTSEELPVVKYDGRDFRIYHAENYGQFFFAEEQNFETVNDAIYNSVNRVADQYDIKISAIDSGLNEVECDEQIRSIILARDNEFEIADNHDFLSANTSLLGLYYNLLDIKELDFSKSWWSQNLIDELTYRNQLYVCPSDMSYNSIAFTRVLYFNKTLFANRQIDEPYKTVSEGNWTFEAMNNIVKNVYDDVNNNNMRDSGDIYGFAQDYPIYCLNDAFGVKALQKTETGLTSVFYSQRTQDIYDKLYSFLYETPGVFFKTSDVTLNMFGNNQVLMAYGLLLNAGNTLRYANANYGIIPVPKYDESQNDYISGSTSRFFIIPINCKDVSFVGTVLQGLTKSGHETIIPAYFETTLKGKLTDGSDESIEMLEIIGKHRYISFSYLYAPEIDNIIRTMFTPGESTKNLSSYYKSLEESINFKLSEVTKAFENLTEELEFYKQGK